MKVLRSTFVAAVAIFAAACGDKVNVLGPSTGDTTAKVNSVTVAPSTAVMAVGQTVAFSAVVDVSNGAATTVSWSSSDASKVSVSATGTASAVAATPGVAICATSTVDSNKKGCASVVVSGGSTGNTPASISIASITGAGGLNCPVPVPPNSVGTGAPAVSCGGIAPGAQLDVRMNLVANSLIAERVDVLVDGVVAGSQTFTAAQLASIASATVARELDPSTQSGIATIVISIAINDCQTGATTTLNLQVTCGAASTKPSWLNGTHTISARVVGHFSGAANASTTTNAGQAIQLLFANVSGFIGSLTVTGTNGAGGTGSAVDGAGFKWVAGTMTVKAIPVIYTGQTAALATITFGATCHGGTGTAANLLPASDGSFSATFSSTSTTQPSVSARELVPGGTCLAVGEMPNIASNGNDNDAIVLPGVPVGANGGAGFLNAVVNLNPDAAFSIRLDNVAPAIASCLLNAITAPGTAAFIGTGLFPTLYPDGAIIVGNALAGNEKFTNVAVTDFALVNNIRKNGWINGATIATSTSTGSGLQSGTDRIVTACPDAGSGRLQATAFPTEEKVEVRAGASTASNATIDATAAIANFAGLAETSTPTNQYRARVKVMDKLGNARTSFNISNVANDGSASTAGTAATVYHSAQAGVVAGNIGTDVTAARVICAATPANGGTCAAAPAQAGAANAGGAAVQYGAAVSAFNFGVDLTPPTLVIANPAITVVGTAGAPCAGRYTITGGQPCTVAAIPNTIYLASDPAGAGGVTGSLFYTANPAPLWTQINRRDAGWTNGLIAGQVSGNQFYCDNAAGTGAAATTLWLPAGGTCNTWPSGNYNQGRVAANIGILTQPQDPNAGGPGGVPAALGALSPVGAGGLNFSGYYTQTTITVDQAGNPTGGATFAPVSNTIVIDNGIPAVGGVAANQPFLVGGGNVNFVSTAADILDIAIQRMALEYGTVNVGNPAAPGVFGPALIDGATGVPWVPGAVGGGGNVAATAQSSWFWQQDQALNTFANGQNNNPPAGFPLPLGAAPLSVNAAFSFPVTGLITNFQLTTAAAVPAGALSAVGVLNTALGQVVNQALTPTPLAAGSLISGASLPVAPNTPGSVAIDATGAANHGPGLFFICGVTASTATLPAACSTAVAVPAAAAVIIPAAGIAGASFAAGGAFTITAISTGATLTFTNPFSQVAFYAYQNATTAGTAGAPAGCLATTEGWRLIGISTVASVSDLGGAGVVGAGRNWQYSINWTPNAVTAPCFATAGQNYRIMAVGIGGSNLAPTSPGMPGTALASAISPVSINLIP